MALPTPVNQLILNGSAVDIGSAGATVTTNGSVSYTTYNGKDCVYINSVGQADPSSPNRLVIPCSVSNTSSFTFSYWINITSPSGLGGWGSATFIPMSVVSANTGGFLPGLDSSSGILISGYGTPAGTNNGSNGGTINQAWSYTDGILFGSDGNWHNFTFIYSDAILSGYCDGILLSTTVPIEFTFNATKIIIGDNWLTDQWTVRG